MRFKATVRSGREEAQEYLEIDGYQDGIEDLLGFRPFPGTLNLEVDKDIYRELKEGSVQRLESFEAEGEQYPGGFLYPISVEGEEAAVLEPDVTDHPPEVLEVVAEDKLRDKIKAQDGDTVVCKTRKLV
nr:MAG: transcriptional regulator of a riboflavin/FAD biosynthetic operon [Candidatus Nanosalinarum sp. J07AB56]